MSLLPLDKLRKVAEMHRSLREKDSEVKPVEPTFKRPAPPTRGSNNVSPSIPEEKADFKGKSNSTAPNEITTPQHDKQKAAALSRSNTKTIPPNARLGGNVIGLLIQQSVVDLCPSVSGLTISLVLARAGFSST